ncbi:MAG: sigma-70 family RNA polymerase sigma factor [Polyangiaceae bacterium]|nr:sigma-70 family RNA polymerase sigma factor [Polyangiaceae bacterium]
MADDREPDRHPVHAHALDPDPWPDDAHFMRVWDGDMVRAARAAAGGDPDAEADVAQEVRVRLLRVSRAQPGAAVPYVRTVIKNAVRDVHGREARAFSACSPLAVDLDADSEPAVVPDDGTAALVVGWVEGLPPRLRDVYEHLCAADRSQREAARRMNVSQPRVAQLHRELLERGRQDLAHLAA